LETFLGCDKEYAEARVALFGAPFDSTTSFRPGARFGPRAMRAESWGLETYSPYQDRDMEETAVFDGGDLELPFGSPEMALSQLEAYTDELVKDGKRPCLLGGEHLVTLGALRAVLKRYPDLHILHFDAHTDLRADYLGAPLSHACVMRRAWELTGDGRIHQFGVRSGEKSEFVWAKAHTDMHPFGLQGLAETVLRLAGLPVYLTIDLDVLDPACFPGTGTPEPGGLGFSQLMEAVIGLGGLQIVGCDLVELAPMLDPSGISAAAACKILRELLLAMDGGSRQKEGPLWERR